MRNIAVAVATVESGGADAGPLGGDDAAAAPDPALSATAAGDSGAETRARSGAVRRRSPGGPVGQRRAVGPVIGEQLAVLLLRNHQPDVLLSHQCACGQPFPCPSRVFGATFLGDQERLTPPIPPPSAAAPAAPAATNAAGPAASAVRAGTAQATAAVPAADDPDPEPVRAVPEPVRAEPGTGRGAPRHGAAEVARGGRQGARRRAAHRADSPDAAPESARRAAVAEEDVDSTQVLERIDPNAEPPAGAQPQSSADLDTTQEFQKIPQDPDVAIAV